MLLSIVYERGCCVISVARESLCCIVSQVGSWASVSPRKKSFCNVSRRSGCGVYLRGHDDGGGMYWLVKLMSWLCRQIRVVCSSSVSSAGMYSSVCLFVLVKGTSLCISVISPLPSPVDLSFRSVVYPGNFGILCLSLSLVFWMAAMCILCFNRCCILFLM